MTNGQSKKHSLLEALTNIFIGIAVNYAANVLVLPYFFKMSLPTEDYIKLTLIYTVISLVRSYCLRRAFNRYHTREVIKPRYLEGNIEL